MKSQLTHHAETIRLGFISGLTGTYQLYCEDQLDGVTLAMEEINRTGGVAGRPVEIFIRDNESSPELSAVRARELLQDDRVDFIVGGLAANTHLPINAETKKAGRIYVSLGQSTELIQAQHLSPFTFHEAWTPHMSAQAMGDWVFKNLGTRWHFVIADYDFGWQQFDSYKMFAARAGATITGHTVIPYPAKTEEQFSEHFPEIMQGRPEILFGLHGGTDVIKFIAAVNKAGLKRRVSIVNTISDITLVRNLKPDEAVGIYWGVNFYWGLEQTLSRAAEFVKKYRARFKKVPSGQSALGYSGALELLEAGRRVNIFPISSSAIVEEMEGHTYAHYKTDQWWRPCDHQSFHDFYVVRLKGAEERTGKDDVGEVIGSTPWDLSLEKTCEENGHARHLWGHFSSVQKTSANAEVPATANVQNETMARREILSEKTHAYTRTPLR